MLNDWDDAIRAAVSARPELQVFVETREDLRVEGDGATSPCATRSRRAGLVVREAGGSRRFVSDPDPDVLGGLVRGRPVEAAASPAATQTEDLDVDEALATVGALLDRAKRVLPAAHFSAVWVEFDQQIRVGGTRPAGDRRRSRRIRLDGVLQKGGRSARAAAECVVESVAGRLVEDLVDRAAERLERRLDAVQADPGPRTIVFAPGVGGLLAHELVGHAAEADAVARGESWLAPGLAFFPPTLTVIDEPRRGRGGWRVDDEGTPSTTTRILSEGRLESFLHSKATAAAAQAASTGHGRVASFRDAVLPRMGCTYIANGERDAEEILQSVQDGIYVRRMESAHTDPSSGFALFRVSDADRIRCGKLVEPLRSHLLETLAVEALAGIDGIADDLAFDVCIGSCHRLGQTVVGSVGAPTFCSRLMKVRI